ncbi:MAG: 3-dehydroquinate synthase [Ignavibacteriaceae bacterium]
MNTLTVNSVKNSYKIYIGNGIFSQLPELIIKRDLSKRIFVIIDSKVKSIYYNNISAALSKLQNKIIYHEFLSNEKNKTLHQTNKIYNSLLTNDFGRDTLIIAIGGGIVGDVAAFAASTYMRGVELIHVPTTLISALDSSIGGKTGVNFSKRKNIIGSFYPPVFVLTDISFLDTLNKTDIRSGMGEIIKYAILSDPAFFNYIDRNFDSLLRLDSNILGKTIINCIKIKKSVVEKDESEKSSRKILNLGHTFGHAIESALDFKVSHGEAVAAGIICSLILAKNTGLISGERFEHLLRLPLRLVNNSLLHSADTNDILRFMEADKKKRDSRKRFILPLDTGNILIDFVAKDNQIRKAVSEFKRII